MSMRLAFLLFAAPVVLGCQQSISGSADDDGIIAQIGAHVREHLTDQQIAFSTHLYCGGVEPCEVGSYMPDDMAQVFAGQLDVSPTTESAVELFFSTNPPDVVVNLSPIVRDGPMEATVLIRYARSYEIVITRLRLSLVQSEWRVGEEVVVSSS